MPVSPKLLSRLVNKLGLKSRWLTDLEGIASQDPLIHELTLDIEEVQSGTLFIARQLWYVDTHQHISEAIERGAAAIIVSRGEGELTAHLSRATSGSVPVLWVEREDPTLGIICDRFYEHPSAELKVYGVTGTNGKTSAVSYLADLLTAVGERVAVIGTVEYRFEDRRLAAPNTTPDALVIQRFLREAVDLGATALTLEVSSHALTLDRVAGLRFDAVGFTSFGRDHLDFHGSLEAYRDAKGRLFSDYLSYALSEGKSPVAVAHTDQEGISMLTRAPKGVRLVRCEVQGEEEYRSALSDQVDQSADELMIKICGAPTLRGIDLSATFKNFSCGTSSELPKLSAPLIGDYHPLNVGIALGMVAGTHPEQLLKAWVSLSSSQGVSGRMERVSPSTQSPDDDRIALVDYAHTPDAIKRALEAIKAVHHGQVSVVIGCGGDRDRGKRPKMLRAALEGADDVWLTSDNPRSEDPQQIIEDALGLDLDNAERSRCHVITDRRSCIFEAWRQLPQGAALLITGKGHESYQEIKGRRYLLSDQETIIASCYAEYGGIALNEVPLVESTLALRTITTETHHYRARLLCLLRESSLREMGLSLMLSVKGKEQIKADDLVWRPKSQQSSDLFSDELYVCVQNLKPKHRRLVIVTEEKVLVQVKAFLVSLISEVTASYPRPKLLLTEAGDERAQVQGGWSSADAGPKIPSLLRAIP